MKRPGTSAEGNVSPPSTKRKIESTTTSKAVASFFKPASQKDPEVISWRTVKSSLIIGKYHAPGLTKHNLRAPVKVAAFDLDDTIISPTTGNRWARGETGWKWWDTTVPGRLKQLHEEGYLVVILSNQGTISLKDDPKKLSKDKASLANFKAQLTSVLRQVDIPISVYAASSQDWYRKPRVGMWEEMKEDYDIEGSSMIDLSQSFYVGDAAGRDKTDQRRKDHAISDRDLAANIGITFYTPDEFFLEVQPEPFIRKFEPVEFLAQTAEDVSKKVQFDKTNPQDIIVFCGSPGAGKSSFYWNKLQPLGYERVNQDILKTRDRCIRKARELLDTGASVVVDNTNRDPETRAHWIALAREFNIPVRCVYFTAPPRLCEHNDVIRALNKDVNPENRVLLPPIAFIDFARRFVEPSLAEGFQDITKVDFKHKTLDVITLFHKPSLPASSRVATILKQASAQASETATEDQASDHSHQNKAAPREPFELEITEAPPTPDQLSNILQYLGNGKIGELVKGAGSPSEALKKLKENPESFQRPVLVDWNQGKAVVGDKESEILKLLKEAPSS